jgi:nucleotide-binding universal stress UspA family protein
VRFAALRFLSQEVQTQATESGIEVEVEVVGITLSQYQRDRAEQLSADLVADGSSLTFKVGPSRLFNICCRVDRVLAIDPRGLTSITRDDRC